MIKSNQNIIKEDTNEPYTKISQQTLHSLCESHAANMGFPFARFLIKFRSSMADFRIPEMQSLAVLNKVDLSFDNKFAFDVATNESPGFTPYLEIKCASPLGIQKICNRSVGIGTASHIICSGLTIEETARQLTQLNESHPKVCEVLFGCNTFKFEVDSYGRKYSMSEQKSLMAHFSIPALTGRVDVKTPEKIFVIHMEFIEDQLKRVWFALKICESNAGHLLNEYSTKKRTYIGTTTMNTELSFFMANQGLVSPSSLILDPFCGTGSVLAVCSAFGAVSIGSEIDPRVLRGNEKKKKTIAANFEQYHFPHLLEGLLIVDNSHTPWREAPIFDAIVCDPPYGLREGAKKIGIKKATEKKLELHEEKKALWDSPDHIKQTVPYGIEELLADLLKMAAKLLVVGGRLVYWLCTTEKYQEKDLPLHPCLKIVSNSEQQLSFNTFRRLITMEKIVAYEAEKHDNLPPQHYGQIQAAHSGANVACAYYGSWDRYRNDDRQVPEDVKPLVSSDSNVKKVKMEKKEYKKMRRERQLNKKQGLTVGDSSSNENNNNNHTESQKNINNNNNNNNDNSNNSDKKINVIIDKETGFSKDEE